MNDARNEVPTAEPGRSRPFLLHPLIYKTMAILALGFVLVAWGFAGTGYGRLELAVVSTLVAVVVVLLAAVAHIRRRGAAPVAEGDAAPPRSFHDWAEGEFATCAGFVKAKSAAIEILLPVAACVAALSAFVIVKIIVT